MVMNTNETAALLFLVGMSIGGDQRETRERWKEKNIFVDEPAKRTSERKTERRRDGETEKQTQRETRRGKGKGRERERNKPTDFGMVTLLE
jgi:hypothetical protein